LTSDSSALRSNLDARGSPDEMCVDDELAWGAHDSERAPEHPELAVIGIRGRVDLEVGSVCSNGCVELERDALSGCFEFAVYV
jgi:hypothetical protein